MTTIIVVAIVALVFFVTVCVVAFMVWKQETKMKTDSLRGIEHSLNEVLHELTGGTTSDPGKQSCFFAEHYDELQDMYMSAEQKTRFSAGRKKKKREGDPFSWVRSEGNEDLKVFRPEEPRPRKLKWTEVTAEDIDDENTEPVIPAASEEVLGQATGEEEAAPFAETAEIVSKEPTEGREDDVGNKKQDQIQFSYIDLEEINLEDLEGLEIEDIDFFDSLNRIETDYDRGRSGKKYTAEELEALIKE